MKTFKEFLKEEVHRSDIKDIMKQVDEYLPSMGFNSIRIPNHMLIRANEADRNGGKTITPGEIVNLLVKQARVNGKVLSRLKDMDEVVLADKKNKIYTGIQKDDGVLVLKTIIRKEGMFRTSDRILSVF